MKKQFQKLSKSLKEAIGKICRFDEQNPTKQLENSRRLIFWLTWVLLLSTMLNITFCTWKSRQLKISEEQVMLLQNKTKEVDEALRAKERDLEALDSQTRQEIERLHKEKEDLDKKLQARMQQRNQLRQQVAVASPRKLPNVSGSCQEWADQASITDKPNALYIFQRESGCRPNAVNKSSGATGVCQALPAHKMKSAGSDYLTNPVTQMRWCQSYAIARYGSWANARAFWDRNRWW